MSTRLQFNIKKNNRWLLPKGWYLSMTSSTSRVSNISTSTTSPTTPKAKYPNQNKKNDKTFFHKTIMGDGNCQYRALAYLELKDENL